MYIIEKNTFFGLGHIRWHGILDENKSRGGKLKQAEVFPRHRKYKFLCAWRKCVIHKISGVFLLPIFLLNKRSDDCLYFFVCKVFVFCLRSNHRPRGRLNSNHWFSGGRNWFMLFISQKHWTEIFQRNVDLLARSFQPWLPKVD